MAGGKSLPERRNHWARTGRGTLLLINSMKYYVIKIYFLYMNNKLIVISDKNHASFCSSFYFYLIFIFNKWKKKCIYTTIFKQRSIIFSLYAL